MLEANGLRLIEIESKSVPFQGISLEEALSSLENKPYLFVAYLSDKVLIGRYEDKKFVHYGGEKLDQRFIVRLRIFDRETELLVLKGNEGFRGRIRKDGEGEKVSVVEAFQVLWGTDAKPLGGGYTRLFEERGTELILPFSNLKLGGTRDRIFLKTLNYVGFDPVSHLATYVDCRFAGFFDKDRTELI